MENIILKTSGISYSYKKKNSILQDLNLSVEKGSIYGFLGPNGAGKTTTLSLLLGVIEQQNGLIEIFGHNIKTNKKIILKKIGSLIETPSLYNHLSAIENLQIYQYTYGLKNRDIPKLLEIVGLGDAADLQVKKFSLGMKQRLAIALALLPDPELLILDEPTNGLDPQGIIDLRDLLKKLNKEGITIIISSHLLSEIEKIVTHIGIINKGKLIFQGPIEELYKHYNRTFEIQTSDNKKAEILLKKYNCIYENDSIFISIQEPKMISTIAREILNTDLEIYQIYQRKFNLEDSFIEIISKLEAK